MRYSTTLRPSDVGARVVLRHRLPGGGATDALGQLLAWRDGLLTVRTRAGVVQVAETDLVAAKTVPASVRRPARSGDDRR